MKLMKHFQQFNAIIVFDEKTIADLFESVSSLKIETVIFAQNMSLVVGKPAFRACDQVSHKPACAASEGS